MQYDVFISCKSEDYKYAEEIYEFLEANGIHTFLASKELRKIGRSLYREAIDDAIDSSYHLIVFSSKSDYVSSDWVKYEWDFFLTLQLSEKRPGQMITILKDVNIKELPKTFLRCQSFFYSSFREDLLRYVETPAFLQRKKKKIQEEQYENAGLNIKVGIDGDIEPKVGRGKKRLLSRLTRLFDTEEHDANNFFEKGCNCYFGENVQQNYVQAVYWFKRAAELGNASAQFNLGVCYANGQGVAQSYTEAVKWYRKAAEQEDVDAQYNLGVCYANGQGVAQSYAEAVKWYRKAAEQGYADAQRNLGVCYYHGQGVSQNYLEAIEWWRKSAEQGNATAQYNLGSCYDNGQTQTRAEAVKWYKKAAEQGLEEAKKALARLQ